MEKPHSDPVLFGNELTNLLDFFSGLDGGRLTAASIQSLIQISGVVQGVLEAQEVQRLTSLLNALIDTLKDYSRGHNKDFALIESATVNAEQLTNELIGVGKAGLHVFTLAASMQIGVIKIRFNVRQDPGERNKAISHLRNDIQHVYDMAVAFTSWNASRFGDPFAAGGPFAPLWYYGFVRQYGAPDFGTPKLRGPFLTQAEAVDARDQERYREQQAIDINILSQAYAAQTSWRDLLQNGIPKWLTIAELESSAVSSHA
jgi:hypothetical protein